MSVSIHNKILKGGKNIKIYSFTMCKCSTLAYMHGLLLTSEYMGCNTDPSPMNTIGY